MNPEGEWKVIFDVLDRAIELNPNNPKYYYDRADTYLEKGDLEPAIDDLEKATDLNPDYIEAYHLLKEAYRRKRELDKTKATDPIPQKQKPEYSPVNQAENSDKGPSELTEVDNISQRSNLHIVGGTDTALPRRQLLQDLEKTRADLALAKLRQAQEELKNVIKTVMDVKVLYKLWSAKTGLEATVFSDQLKAIFSFIPEESEVRFHRKTNTAGTKYLTIRWDSDDEINNGGFSLGKYDEDGSTLIWNEPSNWVQKEKQKNSQSRIPGK